VNLDMWGKKTHRAPLHLKATALTRTTPPTPLRYRNRRPRSSIHWLTSGRRHESTFTPACFPATVKDVRTSQAHLSNPMTQNSPCATPAAIECPPAKQNFPLCLKKLHQAHQSQTRPPPGLKGHSTEEVEPKETRCKLNFYPNFFSKMLTFRAVLLPGCTGNPPPVPI
jgi:hypothetical protein